MWGPGEFAETAKQRESLEPGGGGGQAAAPQGSGLSAFCASTFAGGGPICRQMREFFDLEEPWKVEKGPGGHERRETMTIWRGLQRSLSLWEHVLS